MNSTIINNPEDTTGGNFTVQGQEQVKRHFTAAQQGPRPTPAPLVHEKPESQNKTRQDSYQKFLHRY